MPAQPHRNQPQRTTPASVSVQVPGQRSNPTVPTHSHTSPNRTEPGPSTAKVPQPGLRFGSWPSPQTVHQHQRIRPCRQAMSRSCSQAPPQPSRSARNTPARTLAVKPKTGPTGQAHQGFAPAPGSCSQIPVPAEPEALATPSPTPCRGPKRSPADEQPRSRGPASNQVLVQPARTCSRYFCPQPGLGFGSWLSPGRLSPPPSCGRVLLSSPNSSRVGRARNALAHALPGQNREPGPSTPGSRAGLSQHLRPRLAAKPENESDRSAAATPAARAQQAPWLDLRLGFAGPATVLTNRSPAPADLAPSRQAVAGFCSQRIRPSLGQARQGKREGWAKVD